MINLINKNNIFNISDILKILPHRFPFILIDKILDYKKKIYIKALKNITANDFFFMGHFPKNFIFPGILMVESIAQVSSLLLLFHEKNQFLKKKKLSLSSIKNTRFIHPVYPGDQMLIEVFLKKKLFNFYFFDGSIIVDNIVICKSTISLSFF
ncbi:3-hydroxyacyl-ACP dehydratase FabZ [Buchnera aphidicola]|uniref:3-hydroxyacyl-[acyl-carrier-protein] dehydratase FabZ n=1 Tax=Buchnera aphidicola (Cinara strobi) TaxID=1921549 RepID=A0A3B1E7T5_9GAMM|nr:3-hydroxyacyl-ACP dehydratase FabZ [Buchnera aphidicola]VAX76467.1 3-hydroxyacyl-[acyl-carrier-protein] dehydratase FabZ [Buchnera aphidicola (Cinara strobi)]